MTVWCVKHRDGWCAVAGDREPEEGASWVPTMCGQIGTPRGVMLPWGYERRVPDCPECTEDLAAAAMVEEAERERW